MGFVLLFTNLLSELNCDTRLSWHRANRDFDVLCSVFVFPQKEEGGPRAACPRALVCQGLWLGSEFNISCQTSLHSVMPYDGPVTSTMSGQPGETNTRPACWGGSCRSWEQPGQNPFQRVRVVRGLHSVVPGPWPGCPASITGSLGLPAGPSDPVADP